MSFWEGTKVLITGHTGFKGGWLAYWLSRKGARLAGLSSSNQEINSLFYHAVSLNNKMEYEVFHDIRDFNTLYHLINEFQPKIIFHMAAQPLVNKSYENPAHTYDVNLMGTINLLESIRILDMTAIVVNVTSDKCYRNQEMTWGYRESEPLGGHDPYSNSKACSDLITQSYKESIFDLSKVGIATARSGNVIGGGDWSENRLVPDLIKAYFHDQTINIRMPNAKRPWQHVLDALSGYINLAEKLVNNSSEYSGPWNFGPHIEDCWQVQDIIDNLKQKTEQEITDHINSPQVSTQVYHETKMLKLDYTKAYEYLNWQPVWRLEQALYYTWDWYLKYMYGENMESVTDSQIKKFESF